MSSRFSIQSSNALDDLLTVAQLERALAQREYRLRFSPQAERARIEFEQFPSMIQSFEQHRNANGLPPTQTGFVAAFESDHGRTRADLFTADVRAATEARLQKAYPSLVRDLHLFLLCRESNRFTSVQRGSQLDELYGVDVLIRDHAQREYYVCATAGTRDARTWRTLKQQQRNPRRPERAHLPGTIIELPLGVQPKKVIGNWWLYAPAHVAYIAERMERAE